MIGVPLNESGTLVGGVDREAVTMRLRTAFQISMSGALWMTSCTSAR